VAYSTIMVTQKRRTSYIVYGLMVLFIFIVPRLFQLLTDWYWFVEVGFSTIFTTILFSKILLGLGVGTLTFFVIYGNLWLAKRLVVSAPLIIRLQENSERETPPSATTALLNPIRPVMVSGSALSALT